MSDRKHIAYDSIEAWYDETFAAAQQIIWTVQGIQIHLKKGSRSRTQRCMAAGFLDREYRAFKEVLALLLEAEHTEAERAAAPASDRTVGRRGAA
jgi:hypothetical protein